MSDWRTDPPPQDGRVINVQTVVTMRWVPYRSNSAQRRLGLVGRWQIANEHGGWENAGFAPVTWKDPA